ncbi:hypothetical protein Dform_01478 [Dehalogenimonas formicexedens]|uniref:Uncharacterized protein n=1 Tax=Dehalogenimonas formicexedens TaxID=1839801 RepID=A0A1P8F8P2_9CHLR|nr:hypothetical protein Dform_01478 [Dehalogenimonas formicexedens]
MVEERPVYDYEFKFVLKEKIKTRRKWEYIAEYVLKIVAWLSLKMTQNWANIWATGPSHAGQIVTTKDFLQGFLGLRIVLLVRCLFT